MKNKKRRDETRANTLVERVNFLRKKGIGLFEGGIFDSALIEFEIAGMEASSEDIGVSPEEREEMLIQISRWIIAARDELEK